MMGGKNYAVLVGINDYEDKKHLGSLEYAEKDCQDLYQVLTDPETGIFPTETTTLLLGNKATTTTVLDTLYVEVAKKPTAEDTVLVYFSGHGFVIDEEHPKTYLATQDVILSSLTLGKFRDGLRMSELYDEIFLRSLANNVLFILDSCNSGAFISNSKGGTDELIKLSTDVELIERSFFSGQRGRTALVSCPPGVLSYESKELQNSVFTHYLLEGLRGRAIESETGEVTIDSLLAYVRSHAPSDQLPGRYGQDFGRLVLTKARSSWKEHSVKTGITSIRTSTETNRSKQGVPLKSLLNDFQSFINQLMKLLGDENLILDVENRVLEAVRRASDADFILVLRQNKKDWIARAQSEFKVVQSSQETYIKTVISEVLPSISEDSSSSYKEQGSYYFDEEDTTNKALVLIPLHTRTTTDLMVVCGITSSSILLGEVYSKILSTLYTATNELTTIQVPLIEAKILDALKQVYRMVPIEMYRRRFELFRQRLSAMDIFFQPILYLEPDFLHIDSWEALARPKENGVAPIDLFQAAELWGDEFMIELDVYFVQRAVENYRNASLVTPGRRRYEDAQELSVNVYPQSLVQRAYSEAVEKIIKDKIIQPEKLILEISEKTPLPSAPYNYQGNSLEFFRDKLEKYVRELRIAFAIDDFGVGHASVSRLVGLTPSHVKIDRDILQQRAVDATYRLIVETSTKTHLRIPKVVMEGFDSTSPITLRQLYLMGIRYVQGYIISEAGSKLSRLEQNQLNNLRNLLVEDE